MLSGERRDAFVAAPPRLDRREREPGAEQVLGDAAQERE
jgi:hypothetical protein